MQGYYDYDTNTNVCPSLHVLGSVTSMCAFFDLWRKKKMILAKTALVILTVLISVSTVFLKQHSVIDIFAAIPYIAVFCPLCYSRKLHAYLEKRFMKKKAPEQTKSAEKEEEKEPTLV
jgi:membrane-associated phospholipid phosphatase